MLPDIPFLAINTDYLTWDDNVTLFQLPTGAHKIHPNLKIKVLMRDDQQGACIGMEASADLPCQLKLPFLDALSPVSR